MESRITLLGHPIHPMPIVFPLGLLATAVIFDVIRPITGTGRWSEIAYRNIAAGVIGGLLAAVFGLLDWLALPAGTGAKQIGLWHGAGNVVVTAHFAVSWLLRRGDPAAPGGVALALSCIAVALALATAWLGGELVDRPRVGVDDGAHLNSPSSLSGRPAREGVTGARRA